MAETGVLPPDARVELLDGNIIDMSPIGPFHGGVVARINHLFIESSKGRWFVWLSSMSLDDYSEPQPDLMLLKNSATDYTQRLPAPEDVFLLVEVSDSSLDYDRGDKMRAYARAGIPEVWIVNLVDKGIEVYREPGPTSYASVKILRPGEKASPQAFPDVQVDIAKLLK